MLAFLLASAIFTLPAFQAAPDSCGGTLVRERRLKLVRLYSMAEGNWTAQFRSQKLVGGQEGKRCTLSWNPGSTRFALLWVKTCDSTNRVSCISNLLEWRAKP